MKIIFILTACILIPFLSSAETRDDVSGEIHTGFRVLEVDFSHSENRLTVYRGDYIKFQYPEKFGSLVFAIPDLKYSATLLPDPVKAPFFKMKTVGTYQFSLGKTGGTIRVVDLIRPNYIEVNAQEAWELLKNIDPFVLDVRTIKEYQQFHLNGATLIPIQQLQRRIAELESRKHEDIFIYCATGNRSTVAARILADSGYKRIYNLRYGVYDWARQGFPFKTGKEK